MQNPASLFEVQPGVKIPWGFQTHLNLNSLAMLPVMKSPAFNVAPCPCPSMSTPQFLPPRSSVYNSNLKTQARIQTQQIDSAIQLLKMQYDAIMASVQEKHEISSPLPLPSSATPSQVVDHKSFSTLFELPAPEADEKATFTCVLDLARCKRKVHDSVSCSQSKSPEPNLHSEKRLRRQ